MKTILSLLIVNLTFFSGLAHADLVEVTDKAEKENIRTAALLVMPRGTKTCKDKMGSRRSEDYNLEYFYSAVTSASTVFRDDSGQPVLQFGKPIGGAKNPPVPGDSFEYISITSDQSGTKMVSLSYQKMTLGDASKKNVGTLSRPQIQDVPPQWLPEYDVLCTFEN